MANEHNEETSRDVRRALFWGCVFMTVSTCTPGPDIHS